VSPVGARRRTLVVLLALAAGALLASCSDDEAGTDRVDGTDDVDGTGATDEVATTDDPGTGPATTLSGSAPEPTLAEVAISLDEWVAAADAECGQLSATFAALGEPEPDAAAVERFLQQAAAALDQAATDLSAFGTPAEQSDVAIDIVRRWLTVRELYTEAARALEDGAPLDGDFMVDLQGEVAAVFDPMYDHFEALGITRCTSGAASTTTEAETATGATNGA
jgi:hypothetical protein